MQVTTEDRQAIADLMTGWMHQDLGEWDLLAGLFSPGASIEISWFSGTAADFVAASARMGASDIRLERREGRWLIADRRAVDDFASFTFPTGPIEIDQIQVAAHPIEYAALADVLAGGGFPVRGTYATRGSALERDIKDAAQAWLQEEAA